eukprot:601986-Prorocentrum_minimum.AAC.1
MNLCSPLPTAPQHAQRSCPSVTFPPPCSRSLPSCASRPSPPAERHFHHQKRRQTSYQVGRPGRRRLHQSEARFCTAGGDYIKVRPGSAPQEAVTSK